MGPTAIPPPSTEGARRTMLANRRRDTRPELAVRRILHARGFRYRVDFAPIAGLRSRADVVFTRARVAVFIDGCFWHMCPDHFIMPKSNRDYWEPKLARNVERDRLTDVRMADAGWKVMRYWEHDDAGAVADDIAHRLHADLRKSGSA